MIKKAYIVEHLMSTYGDYLKRTATLLVGDPHLAEDLTQETFISFYKSCSSFRGEASHKTYLYRILVNHVNMYRRKPKEAAESYEGQVASSFDNPAGTRFESGTVERMDLLQAIKDLKEDYRMVIWLFYYCDLPVEAIAKILEISKSGVKMRLMRGREMLKEQLVGVEEMTYESN